VVGQSRLPPPAPGEKGENEMFRVFRVGLGVFIIDEIIAGYDGLLAGL
jgi:hypothetical protein